MAFDLNDIINVGKTVLSHSQSGEALDVASLVGDASNASVNEVFTSEFMTQHAKVSSLSELLQIGQTAVTSISDLSNLDESKINAIVAKATDFDSWQDMLGTAVKEYAAKKLSL